MNVQSPAWPIWELTSGYSSDIRGLKPLVALQAHIDDSAGNSGERFFVLAGYINSADNWIHFSNAWDNELRRPPSIDYLKMSEAQNLSGQFRRWKDTDRDKKIQRLAHVIRQFKPASISCAVKGVEFDTIIKPVAPYGLGMPYFFCFQGLMISLANLQLENNNAVKVPIDFIFDEQKGLDEFAKYFYKLIREAQAAPLRRLLSKEPIFRDDKLVLPLQAADLLAWHIRRGYEKPWPNNYIMPDFLSGNGEHIEIYIDDSRLREHAANYIKADPKGVLVKKSAWKRTHLRKKLDDPRRIVRRARLKNTLGHWADRLFALFKKRGI